MKAIHIRTIGTNIDTGFLNKFSVPGVETRFSEVVDIRNIDHEDQDVFLNIVICPGKVEIGSLYGYLVELLVKTGACLLVINAAKNSCCENETNLSKLMELLESCFNHPAVLAAIKPTGAVGVLSYHKPTAQDFSRTVESVMRSVESAMLIDPASLPHGVVSSTITSQFDSISGWKFFCKKVEKRKPADQRNVTQVTLACPR